MRSRLNPRWAQLPLADQFGLYLIVRDEAAPLRQRLTALQSTQMRLLYFMFGPEGGRQRERF